MNIREIARLANVTPGTVSKVLNNYPDISEATRAHVRQIIEENQYTPAFGSKFSGSGSTANLVGMVIEGANNALYDDLYQDLSTRLHNAEYTILSYTDNFFMQDKTEKFEEILKYLNAHKLSGFVYFGGNFAGVSPELFDKLPCPTIFVNTVLPVSFSDTNYSSINTNHYDCGKRQMELLIEKGHKNIALMISSLNDNSVYGLRMEGYKDALAAAGLTGNLKNVAEGWYLMARSYSELKKLLEKHPEITAVCVSADVMTPAVLRVLHDLRKTPGKDVDVISYDGLEYLEYSIPRVTGFVQPVKEMAEGVYDLLMGLINKERSHQHIIFQSKYVKRETL
ncbi:MAG: LacI family transcriptional regulator [Lachnospiraceae bacterium]|nr:LacI family transcriptional regulator [Lachnospiraceae bacterium]